MLFLLLFGASIIIALPAAAATTLYVDSSNPTCANAGPGSQTIPFCTIKSAANAAIAGQTVQVAAGDYPENISIANSGTQSAPIVFQPAPGALVKVGNAQTRAFTVSGKSWIQIKGFTVSETTGIGIYLKNASNITLSGNRVTQTGMPVNGSTAQGIYVANTNDSLIVGNTVDHNSDSGIYLTSGSTGNEIRGNVSFANARQYTRAATGIDVRTPGNTIVKNVTHDNEDSGIQLYNGATNCVVVGNVSYRNGDHGIDVLNSTGVTVVANTVYNSANSGINLEGASGSGGSSGATVANNISVDNGLIGSGAKGNIRVDASSTAGTTLDYDLVYLSTPGKMMTWGSTSYTSLAAMTSATGQEVHGLQADPGWKAAASNDFHLVAGSRAIDSANSSAPSEPATDAGGDPRVDDPATPNIGVGSRTFDDRGAFEYQPDLPPNAALSVTPASGTVPLSVSADASASTDADLSPISTYTFDFGDGTTIGPQVGAVAVHSYQTPGTYTVTVMVTDTAGLSSSAVAQVVANPSDFPPTAALTVTPASGAVPLDVTADASASTDTDATPIATYRFDFGDGTVVGPQTGGTATHTYQSVGTYTAKVTVTDTAGQSSDATSQVSVTSTPQDNPPNAALSVTPSSGTAPLQVSADASASTDTDATPIANYRFDFGDGTVVGPQAGATATHTYQSAGTYTAKVTVTDTAGQSSDATSQVVVTQPGGTNLVGNPGFETDTLGWKAEGSTAIVFARVPGGHSGSSALRLSNTGTASSACTLNDSPNWVARTTAGTYTGSVWVRADSAGASLKVRFREYNGSTFVSSATTTITLSTSWQQVTVAYIPQVIGSTLDFNVYLTTAPTGVCFYADDVSIVRT